MSSIWIPKWIFGFINESEDRCQGSEYQCQVYGFQSGFLVLLMKVRTGVKDLSTGVKYMDSKVDFWFY